MQIKDLLTQIDLPALVRQAGGNPKPHIPHPKVAVGGNFG